jgi:hypothetical protein
MENFNAARIMLAGLVCDTLYYSSRLNILYFTLIIPLWIVIFWVVTLYILADA